LDSPALGLYVAACLALIATLVWQGVVSNVSNPKIALGAKLAAGRA
jgi:hypothetical protein